MASVYEDAEERACRLVQAFSGLDLRLVLYVRPQLPWLESVYAQHIQEGRVLTAEAFLSAAFRRRHLRWADLMSSVEGAIGPGRVEVRPFGGGDVVADFFSSIGKVAPSRPVVPENSSLSPARTCILRELNGLAPTDSQRARRYLQRVVPERELDRQVSSFSPALQTEVEERYVQDWLDVGKRFSASADDSRTPEGIWAVSRAGRPRRQVGIGVPRGIRTVESCNIH